MRRKNKFARGRPEKKVIEDKLKLVRISVSVASRISSDK